MGTLRARLSGTKSTIEKGEASLFIIVYLLGAVVVASILCSGVSSFVQWQNSEHQQALIEQPERAKE